jgi:Domain of unknown function (DUF5666)
MSMSRVVKVAALVVAAVSMFLTGEAPAATLPEQAFGDAVIPLASQQLEVEGKGVISLVSGSCPALVVTISGIPITVNAATVFPIGQSCGQLATNQLVEVRGTLTVAGGALSVVAKTIEIEDGNEGEGEGRVTAVSGTCPDLTITVDGITVKLDALTRYTPADRGASCALIKLGTKVRVKAVPAPGGGFRARTIHIKGQRTFGEGESRITSVSGACPDRTIFFGETGVAVNAATVYDGGTCGDLGPGVRVQAKGFRDDDATQNVATYIKFKSRRVEGRSVVTKVTGTCPALSITLGGAVKVVTDANTVFKGGSCLMIRTGVRVRVKGDMKAEDGSVIAEEVEIEGQPGDKPGGRLEGTIETLTGACPVLDLKVKGIPVKTSAATKFDDVACTALKVGTKVEVEGDVQGGVLIATKIELED